MVKRIGNDYDNPLNETLEFFVDSIASDPHLGGAIQVRCTPSRLQIRWQGERAWLSLEWHEVLLLCSRPNAKVKDEIEYMKAKAYEDAFKAAVDDERERVQQAEKRAGAKLVRIVQ